MKQNRAREITLTAIVAAIYAAITLSMMPIAFGPVQLRLSEGLNHLSAFNKRYILALGLGVFIANFLSPTSLGWVDWVFGTLGTVIMTAVTYWLTRRVTNTIIKILISTIVVSTLGMAILAAEFVLAFNLSVHNAFPSGSNGDLVAQWWAYYVTVVPGELASLIVGAVVIFALSKIVDLAK